MGRSSGFPGDPYGHVTNQCGHMVLGLAVAALMPFALLADAVTVVALYWLLVEVLDQRKALFRDALEDAGFVAAGASIPAALAAGYWFSAGLLTGAGLALAIGWWRRS